MENNDYLLNEPNVGSHRVADETHLIAETLRQLSIEEREKVYEDVHCVSQYQNEPSYLVRDSILRMEAALDQTKDKAAYDKAKSMSETYVTDFKFRLKFLRASEFHPENASKRMVKHFKTKLKIFGEELLVKDIELDDFGGDVLRSFDRGSMQALPIRDSQGRAVMIAMPAFHLNWCIEARHIYPKLFWYLLSSIAEDEETQKKGMVFISYSLDSKLESNEENDHVWWACILCAQSLPVRFSSFHYCYNTPTIGSNMKLFISAGNPFTRARMRMHQGTHHECRHKLMTFGIATNDFPISFEGKLINGKNSQWIKRRRQKEAYLRSNVMKEGAVDLPSKFDVLLGKGKPYQEHFGNVNLHEIIATYYPKYDSATRDVKASIVEEIVGLLGRFLKRDEESGMWIEATPKEAKNKVSHGFRRKREFDLKKAKSCTAKSTAVQLSVGTVGKKRFKAVNDSTRVWN